MWGIEGKGPSRPVMAAGMASITYTLLAFPPGIQAEAARSIDREQEESAREAHFGQGDDLLIGRTEGAMKYGDGSGREYRQ